MIRRFASANPVAQYVSGPMVAVPANDPRISYSDLPGVLLLDEIGASCVRPIDDGPTQNFKFATPGFRSRFRVVTAQPAIVLAHIAYTGLITRLDTYNDVGLVLINGNGSGVFRCGVTRSPGGAHPITSEAFTIALPAGESVVELVAPYCASVEWQGIEVPSSVMLSEAPARPAKRLCAVGDSIVHGFNTTDVGRSWASLLAEKQGAQLVNLGFGGRMIEPSDGEQAGNAGADVYISNPGINDYLNGRTAATIKAQHKLYQQAFRSAVSRAGKPSCRLFVLTPLWSDLAPFVPGGATLAEARQAIRDAVSEVGDPLVTIIEGLGPGMPTGPDAFPDHVHPNDQTSVIIADVLHAAIG